MSPRPVLLVDARENSRAAFSLLLQQSGYAVLEAERGEEALSLLRTHEVSAVITELVVPGMDGCELARQIRQDPATAHVPVLVITADAAPENRARAQEVGCSAFMLKPCMPKEILQEVREAMQGAIPPQRWMS